MNGTIRLKQQTGNSSGRLCENIIVPRPNSLLRFNDNRELGLFDAAGIPRDPSVVPLSVTNVQKLSLSPSTPALTRVSVSDGFYLHDSVYGDVFYYTNGTAPSDGSAPAIEKYSPANRPDLDDITWRWNNANDATQGGAWGDAGGNYAGLSDDSVTHFWDTPTDTIDHTYTVSHPALQKLAYADPSQEEFWTADGTLPDIYYRDENGLIFKDENGHPYHINP